MNLMVVKHVVDDINLIRNIQTETRSEIMKRINETSTVYCQNRKIVVFLMLILFCIISIIIFGMLY